MKKIIAALAIALGLGGAAFADSTTSYSDLKGAFQSFADDLAPALPFASSMGLNWSSAMIGYLPHFGVGLAGGAVFIPATGFNDVGEALGLGDVIPAVLETPGLGLPFPAVVAEARIGGIILPFDVGIKYGTLPEDGSITFTLPQGMNFNYHLYGIDARLQLVKEGFLLPQVSVGVGFNHIDGFLSMTTGSNINVTSLEDPNHNEYDLAFSAPTLEFDWNSNALDASIELSKTILWIVTPYIGAGLSYGISSAGGGLSSNLTVQENGGGYHSPTTTDENNINSALEADGQQPIDWSQSNQGFLVSAGANGYSARVFGGASVNLLFVKLDVTGMINLNTMQMGATVGARAQF